MSKTLDFFQVYFKEEQKERLYDFAIPYFNETLTDSFENSIIADLVPKSEADYIAVCSWRLRQKRSESSTPMVLNGELGLSKEKILSHDFDVAILTPRHPDYRPLDKAANWHGKAWADAFTVFVSGFLNPLGVRVPDVSKEEDLTYAIHENHFIARREIYQDYVQNVLTMAIRFCEQSSIFKQDSGYIYKKRDRQEIKDYQEKSGRTDWPIQPFILERLFSIWINDKGFKVINL